MRRLLLLSALIAGLTAGAAGQSSRPDGGGDEERDEAVVSVATRLVAITLTVEGAGSGEAERAGRLRALRIFADDERQETAFVSDGGGCNVALLVDVSASMRGRKFTRVREAVRVFLEKSDERNRYTLILFGSRVRSAGEFSGDAEGRRALLAAVGEPEQDGHTVLYDALIESGRVVGRMATGRAARAVVAFTDGADKGSEATAEEASRRLDALGGLLYIVVLSERLNLDYEDQLQTPAAAFPGPVLKELRRATGGEVVGAGTDLRLRDAAEDLAKRLRRTVQIGFYARGEAGASGRHGLRVVDWKGRRLQGRPGYFIE